jgi:hypothetical protein
MGHPTFIQQANSKIKPITLITLITPNHASADRRRKGGERRLGARTMWLKSRTRHRCGGHSPHAWPTQQLLVRTSSWRCNTMTVM